jgi:hypothetical protein
LPYFFPWGLLLWHSPVTFCFLPGLVPPTLQAFFLPSFSLLKVLRFVELQVLPMAELRDAAIQGLARVLNKSTGKGTKRPVNKAPAAQSTKPHVPEATEESSSMFPLLLGAVAVGVGIFIWKFKGESQ